MVDYWLDPPPNSMIKEAKTLETLPNGDKISYMRIKMPMMSEREAVTKDSVRKLEDGSLFLSVTTVDHPDAPKVKGAIRMF